MKKKILRRSIVFLIVALLAFVVEAVRIVTFPSVAPAGSYDCAIVLGAAVRGEEPSPVFEGRLEHAVALYREGKVKALIFTGGYGTPGEAAESEVGMAYAMGKGVPAFAISTEENSHTTRENIIESKLLMEKRGFRSALVVSDPLHLRRALLMRGRLGLDAKPSGTPTSRYATWSSKLPFLLRETFFSFVYRVAGK